MRAFTDLIKRRISSWTTIAVIYASAGIFAVGGLLYILIGGKHSLAIRVGEPSASFIVAAGLLMLAFIAIILARATSRENMSWTNLSHRAAQLLPTSREVELNIVRKLKSPTFQIGALLLGGLGLAAARALEYWRAHSPAVEILPPLNRSKEELNATEAVEALLLALGRNARRASRIARPHVESAAMRVSRWLGDALGFQGGLERDQSIFDSIRRRSFIHSRKLAGLNLPSARSSAVAIAVVSLALLYLNANRK